MGIWHMHVYVLSFRWNLWRKGVQDQARTAFCTLLGTFCDNIPYFSLKSAKSFVHEAPGVFGWRKGFSVLIVLISCTCSVNSRLARWGLLEFTFEKSLALSNLFLKVSLVFRFIFQPMKVLHKQSKLFKRCTPLTEFRRHEAHQIKYFMAKLI